MNQHFSAIDGDRLAKRNALVLAGAQALGGANPAIIVSLGGIVGAQLVADQAFGPAPRARARLEFDDSPASEADVGVTDLLEAGGS